MIYFFKIEFVKLSSTEAVPIYTPSPVMTESVYFPTVASTNIDYQVLFNLGNLIGENWHFNIVLIWVSFIMTNIEHFFICMRIICISILTNYPYLLPIFLLVCFFSYWFYTLYIPFSMWRHFPSSKKLLLVSWKCTAFVLPENVFILLSY